MKYWQLLKTACQRHLAYRARVLIWAATDLGYFAMFPFLWLTIYGARTTIAGYGRADIVTYYLIIACMNMAISSHATRLIREDIVGGKINALLVQPLSYFLYRAITELAYKFQTLIIVLLISYGLFLFFPEYIVTPPSGLQLIGFCFSLILSFFLSHLMEYMTGLMSFWFGEVRALEHVKQNVIALFSGQLAPLRFFPLPLQTFAHYLPFASLSYIPASIYLNQLTGSDMFYHLGIATLWILILAGAVSLLWRRGLRQYEGVGI